MRTGFRTAAAAVVVVACGVVCGGAALSLQKRVESVALHDRIGTGFGLFEKEKRKKKKT